MTGSGPAEGAHLAHADPVPPAGPLDPEADYEPYLETDRSLTPSASGQELCLSGLRYGETAELTLRAGLPSADGQALETDEQVTLSFADRLGA